MVLQPEAKYRITRSGTTAEYLTNEFGQLDRVKFDILELRPEGKANRLADGPDTTPIGKLGKIGNVDIRYNDVGFHLLGDQFYGAEFYLNLVPANYDLNDPFDNAIGGGFGQLETWWRQAVLPSQRAARGRKLLMS